MKLSQFPAEEETVLVLLERVSEAQRIAARELREMQAGDPRKKKRKNRDVENDDALDGEGGVADAALKKRKKSRR